MAKGFCLVCGDEMDVQMCCSGRDCGCMGQPVEPPVCCFGCDDIFLLGQLDPIKGEVAKEVYLIFKKLGSTGILMTLQPDDNSIIFQIYINDFNIYFEIFFSRIPVTVDTVVTNVYRDEECVFAYGSETVRETLSKILEKINHEGPIHTS